MCALSNSSDFNLNTLEIITMAYENLGVKVDVQDLSNAQIILARKELNAMVKNWSADNVNLWKREWLTYAFTASSVVLGDDGYDYECIRNHTSSATDEAYTGGKSMSYWKKLTTSAGDAWVTGTAYTSICNIALGNDVIGLGSAFLREDDDSIDDTYLDATMTRDEYFGMSGKADTGQPTQVYFERRLDNNSIFLYPYPDSSTDYILNIEVYEYPEDFDSNTNSPDFLQEWIAPLTDGLTMRLYPKFPSGSYSQLKERFKETYERARMSDSQKGNVSFSPGGLR